MKIVGCDLHAKQQTIALVDTETGELLEKILLHEGNAVGEFYARGAGNGGHRSQGRRRKCPGGRRSGPTRQLGAGALVDRVLSSGHLRWPRKRSRICPQRIRFVPVRDAPH
jgi:hypothetical protein